MHHQPKQAGDPTYLSPRLWLRNCGTLVPRSVLQLFGTEQVLRHARPFKDVAAGNITYLHSPLLRFLSFWDDDIPNSQKKKKIKGNFAEER